MIGLENNKVVSCAIVDCSRTLPDKIYYEIFYNFDEEIKKIENEISFFKNLPVYDNSNEKNLIALKKYQKLKCKLEEAKYYFMYNDFYYIVFLESLVPGNHYGCKLVEYMKTKYINLIALPFPRNVYTFWVEHEFLEINNLCYYKKDFFI